VLPYIALTPEPILAAIVIHALARGLSLQPLGRYFIWRRDRVLVMCAVGAVLVLGVLDGLLVSVAISVLLMLKQMSAANIQILGRIDGGHDFVDVQRHPAAETVPGVLVVRPDEALFLPMSSGFSVLPALDPAPTGADPYRDPQSGRVPRSGWHQHRGDAGVFRPGA
jgi:MFS superfamily sulfate permease-like transporter